MITNSENQTAYSADGTRIGFTKIGSGPVPLVIVHGALSVGVHWMPVAEAMAAHCTCYVMDRWGRGTSEDHNEYSLESEVDDIRAVLEAAGPNAYLLGHSSGAIYALETALQYPLTGLVLYEPPLHAFHGRFVEDALSRMRVAAREERFEDVVAIFARDEEGFGVSDDELSHMRTTPRWENMVALAPQSVCEWEELAEIGLTVDRYRGLQVPTLLLTGTLTKDHPSFATRALASTLPNARTVLLDGQNHLAHAAAPELVANEVVAFIRGNSR